MNASVIGLIKNLCLLALVVFTAIVFLFNRIEDWAALLVQGLLGVLYLGFFISETVKTKQTVTAGEKRFFYLTNGTLAKKAIRIGGLIMGSVILYLSHTRLQNIALVVFIMLISEAIVFLFRLKLKSYFISIKEPLILINADREIRIFASQIA